MRHHKFNEIITLVKANMPVLLTGEKGSGKTTMAMQVAEELELTFYSMSMTRQTTLSHLLGFINVNGDYVPSQLRHAAVEGGAMLIDEIDAGDANVLLSLNTIENGYIAFPDQIIKLHDNFRLMATSNPQHQHAEYVGRNKLDAATLDRFDQVDIPHDENLERSLIDNDVYMHIKILREALRATNSSRVVSMRDAMRYQKRKELGLLEGYVYKLTGNSDLVYEKYQEAANNIPKFSDQSECDTIDDLYKLMEIEYGNTKPNEDDDPYEGDNSIPF